MPTKAGVGFSEHTHSREAGIEAARMARDRSESESPDLVLVMATAKHNPTQLVDGVRTVVGEQAHLFGGSTSGIITNEQVGHVGYQVGVAVLSSDRMNAEVLVQNELADREYEAGRRLGEQLNESDASSFIFLYDFLKRTVPEGGPELNWATPLLEGMDEALDEWPTTAGAGLLTDAQFIAPAHQWGDDRIEQQSVIGLALSGDVRMDTLILHGCKPSSPYYTITRVEDSEVLEIEGRPALDVIDEVIGRDGEVESENYPLFVTLGHNKGEKYAPYKEESYAIRNSFAIDEERRSLRMFEPDLQAGDEVQLMRRSFDLDYIGERIQDFLKGFDGRSPSFAFYIDCTGRAPTYSGLDEDEAEEVQKHIGDIPLLGFYSGCEIAKCGSGVQPLSWTGVLCVFSEPVAS